MKNGYPNRTAAAVAVCSQEIQVGYVTLSETLDETEPEDEPRYKDNYGRDSPTDEAQVREQTDAQREGIDNGDRNWSNAEAESEALEEPGPEHR